MRNVPESEVAIPVCLPRIITETFAKGFSSSPNTLPEIKAAFFCANADWDNKQDAISKMGSTTLNEKLFMVSEFKQIWLQSKRK